MRTRPLDALWDTGTGVYDTALFATVLHHEPDPAALVERVLITLRPTAGNSTVVAGCLRNATAAGRWLATRGYGTPECPVGVIASGERWPDGSLRPALEDLFGAGAIIAELQEQGAGPLSPEAAVARSSFTGTPKAAETVACCSSGLELVQGGFADDPPGPAAVSAARDEPGTQAPGTYPYTS
ncbi:2-phosphosulfolactate phosphatase [Streptomyces sp. NPDC058457]|uniref:2-phosphosulfolactate phosphatase n=1 Tax=Streptomyces sp. NPDC058457 TaxID=3346507 RepID=UPI0036667BD9